MAMAMAMMNAYSLCSLSSSWALSPRVQFRRNATAAGILSMHPHSRCSLRHERTRVFCSSQDEESAQSKAIRFTIEAHAGDETEPPKLVIELPDTAAAGAGRIEVPEESVTNIASESAVECPQKVHEAAEREASKATCGGSLEEAVEEIEHEAEKVSSEAADATRSEDGPDNKGGVIESVTSGLEMAKEAVNKRAKVLAMAAEDAGHNGSQIVDAARKGMQDLKQKLEGGIPTLNVPSGGTEQQYHGDVYSNKVDDHHDDEKHSAVDVEDVNKDGEAVLNMQREQEEEDSSDGAGRENYNQAVKEVMKEFVEPALEVIPGEVDEVELGDGNEHLKNMNDLEKHDTYAPIEAEEQ